MNSIIVWIVVERSNIRNTIAKENLLVIGNNYGAMNKVN